MEICPKCDGNMKNSVCIDCLKEEIVEWIGREEKHLVEIVEDVTEEPA